MGWRGLWVLALAGSLHAADYKMGTCQDSGFVKTGGWAAVAAAEPKIQEALNAIGQASGSPSGELPLTNCRVSWPVNERGESLDGYRVVVLDKVWYSYVNGQQVKNHGGIKFVYDLRTRTEPGWGGGYSIIKSREVTALSTCWRPSVCEFMDIPVRLPGDKGPIPTGNVQKQTASGGGDF